MQHRIRFIQVTERQEMIDSDSVKTNPVINPWIFQVSLIKNGRIRQKEETISLFEMVGSVVYRIVSLSTYNTMENILFYHSLGRVMTCGRFLISALEDSDGFPS